MSSVPAFKLLEINLVSAQDLAMVARSMQTYAVAWINPARKLATRIDPKGHNNPKWNDKFVFRVDDGFLNSESAAFMIELYSQAWLRDLIVGSVRVQVSSLIPHQKSSTRFVALQIRRSSGRPQGILNVGVSVHDGTMKSMPLFSELGSSALGYPDNKSRKTNAGGVDDVNSQRKAGQLRRTRSERSWSDNDDPKARPGAVLNGRSVCNGSAVGTEISALPPKVANGSDLCSDVGPSPSVVAAAVAKGLYPIRPPPPPKDDGGSSILRWTDDQSEEGLRSKLERWRMEMHPSYGRDRPRRRRGSRRSGKGREGGGYTCFGKVFGCEFTIVCGAGDDGSRRKHSGGVHLSTSDSSSESSMPYL